MAERDLSDVRRVELDAFDPDPTRVGGVRVLRDPALYQALAALKECPAAWNKEPTTKEFNQRVLGLRAPLKQTYGWDVVPHFVLISNTGDMFWPIHTDWEGATFLDPGLFTLWAPLSHFGQPHLMVFQPEYWPPPDHGFDLDETGLYGRTMDQEGMYRRFARRSRLAAAEIALQEGEVLAFNGSVPHCSHPDAAIGRLAINVRCPGNLGTETEPRVRMNPTSLHAASLLPHSRPSPRTRVARDLDPRTTPKGYFELGPAHRSNERRTRILRSLRRVPGLRRLGSWLLRA